MFNLINHQLDIDQIYLYAKDSFEAKYQLLINKQEIAELNHLNDSKAFLNAPMIWVIFMINIEEYKSNKKCKILITFNDMNADVLSNKKLNTVVTELFIRGRKLHISLVFITKLYFSLPKDIRLNSMHYFILKIPKKPEEFQLIAFNHLSAVESKDFMNFNTKAAQKELSFRKNLLKRI